MWWELFQDDISPNHEGEECSESYSRMIFLQIMRERSVARAIPKSCIEYTSPPVEVNARISVILGTDCNDDKYNTWLLYDRSHDTSLSNDLEK
jgi:hypothetical protein